MKPLVIYHKNCLDGFGAAFAAWLRYRDSAEYVPLDYSEREEFLAHNIILDRIVYVLDFSFNKVQTEYLKDSSAEFIWLDHHKSAFEEYGILNHFEAEIDYVEGDLGVHILLSPNQKSGARLAWDYFHGPLVPTPMFINHIDDRDRWVFKIPWTNDFCKALSMLPQDFIVWDTNLLVRENREKLYERGSAINEYYQEQLSRALEATTMSCSIGEVQGLCANLPPVFSSEAGSELAKQSGTFGATWFETSRGTVKWSLRSIGDFDVAAIAKKFGGGGHKNAAGFELNPSGDHEHEGIKLWHT